MPEEKPAVWAVCELMGHVRLAGRLTEEEKFGSKLGRLDIPAFEKCTFCRGKGYEIGGIGPNGEEEQLTCNECENGVIEKTTTIYFGGSSVYRITIVTEAVARHIAKQASPAPVQAWDFPKQLTITQDRPVMPETSAPAFMGHDQEDDFDDDEDIPCEDCGVAYPDHAADCSQKEAGR